MKGGVGKTTLTANLAIGMSRLYNKKVLLVDLDPQFNLTQYLMHSQTYLNYKKNNSNCTIKDIFIKRATDSIGLADNDKQEIPKVVPTIKNCTVRIETNGHGYVDLIPSTLDLMEADVLERGIEHGLSIFLRKVRSKYEYILIDCPPTVSLFTTSAYLASDAYVTPIKPDLLSSIGLSLINRSMTKFTQRYGKTINFIGIIFVMVKKNKLMQGTMKTLRSQDRWKCFTHSLSDSVRIAETNPDKNIFDLDSKNQRYRNEMTLITDEFILRLKK